MQQTAAIPLVEESRIGDYISLLKPRVMSLVVFTGIIGLLLAPGSIHPFMGIMSILAIALGSGGAGAINMWYDRDIDKIMTRTKYRPIPQGVIDPEEGLAFGIVISLIAVILLFVATNPLAAALLASAIFFYVGIYTMLLKRHTIQNIVIGGAAGAFPPMIGWAAVTGDITIMPIILFSIIFFWTPPHFWSLALVKSDDYKRANIPMMPVVKGNIYTQNQIILYTFFLTAISLLPTILGLSGLLYLIGSILLNVRFLMLAIACRTRYSAKLAMHCFFYSIFYLFALFLLLYIDHIWPISG